MTVLEPEPIVYTNINIECVGMRQDGTEAVLSIAHTRDFNTIDRKHLTLLEALQMYDKLGQIQQQLYGWIQAKMREAKIS